MRRLPSGREHAKGDWESDFRREGEKAGWKAIEAERKMRKGRNKEIESDAGEREEKELSRDSKSDLTSRVWEIPDRRREKGEELKRENESESES